jgi:hypothetical protein
MNDKNPQPQVAPTLNYLHDEIDTRASCPSCDRILAAIKDDVMAEKLAGHCSDCRKVINAYRAALMERIKDKQPEPYTEERHADVGMIEEQQ